MPRLEGWEDDISYFFIALALSQSQSQLPATITTLDTREVEAGVLITPFASPALLESPDDGGFIGEDRVIEWRTFDGYDGPMRQEDATVIEIAEPSLGPPTPLWRYVVPAGERRVSLPILPRAAGGAGLNGGFMLLSITPFRHEGGFDYDDFTYLDINGARWASWGLSDYSFQERP